MLAGYDWQHVSEKAVYQTEHSHGTGGEFPIGGLGGGGRGFL